MLTPISQKAGNPLKDVVLHREFREFRVEDVQDNLAEHRTEVYEQDLCLGPWSVKILKDVVQCWV